MTASPPARGRAIVTTVAALFVASGGTYFNLPGVDPERRRTSGAPPNERLSKVERLSTPVPFRDVLIAMARMARGEIASAS